MRRGTVKATIAVAVMLLVPLAAVATDFCIGNNCGAGRDGWHCHSINSSGTQCWDAFDNSCESQPGFSFAEGAVSCSIGSAGVGGAVASQLPVLGGATIFASQIQTRAVPRSLSGEVSTTAAAAGEGGDGLFIGEITTSAELEDWTIGGVDGETQGLRFGYNKQNAGGRIVGFGASYQEAEADIGGSSTELLNANFTWGHTLGETWKWGVSGIYSDIGGVVDESLFGGAVNLSFTNYTPSGSVLSGGVIGQFLTADNLPDDIATVGLGLAYGIPIAQRMAVDLDAYYTTIVEPDVTDDAFFSLGGTFSYYFSSRFGLTLGYKVLEGIDAVDSSTITLGTSTRWQ